jgi:hypothetical protein
MLDNGYLDNLLRLNINLEKWHLKIFREGCGKHEFRSGKIS